MVSDQRRGRLKIVACRQVYSGINPGGHRFTIFEVDAAKRDGTLVKEKLRSFRPLPIGQEVEVDITPFESERHGRSFTLHPVESGPSDAEVGKLAAEVAELTQRVEALERLADPRPATPDPGQPGQW